ncbi:MAG: two-component sensor histidine kinase [Myxococcales bacterium]|nr:two-component sensor histidine kinase [Myxococcales bacterium]
MGFRKQLSIGLAASVVVTVLTAVTAIVALRMTTKSADQISRRFAEDLASVQNLRLEAEHLVATSRGYLLTGQADQRSRFLAAQRQFDHSLYGLASRALLTRTADEVAVVSQAAGEYVRAVREAGYERTMSGDPRSVLKYFESELWPRRDKFEESVDAFVREEQELFDDAFRESQARADKAQTMLVLTSVLGVGISIVLAVLVLRRLTREFQHVQEATGVATRAAKAREEILAVVSHDLRNPLNAVVLGASLLEESPGLPAPERRYVSSIRSASDRMQHLIDELVDNAHVEAGQLVLRTQACEAQALLHSAVELFVDRAPAKGVKLRSTADPGLRLDVDRERILQVLSNLLGNALKFARPGDEITATAERRARIVRFEVRDTGTGIPEDQLPHLFERYWQGKRTEKGSVGLGLYICKHIVEAHGGTIGVTSEPGQGSAFWFELPLAASRESPT